MVYLLTSNCLCSVNFDSYVSDAMVMIYLGMSPIKMVTPMPNGSEE